MQIELLTRAGLIKMDMPEPAHERAIASAPIGAADPGMDAKIKAVEFERTLDFTLFSENLLHLHPSSPLSLMV